MSFFLLLRFASARGHRPPPRGDDARAPRRNEKLAAGYDGGPGSLSPTHGKARISQFLKKKQLALPSVLFLCPCIIQKTSVIHQSLSNPASPVSSSIRARLLSATRKRACVTRPCCVRERLGLWALASWRARVACRLGRFWGDIPRRAWSPLTSASLMMHRHAV